MSESVSSMRVDKWLWCARFFKTRSLAAEAVRSGKIKINGDKAKPARSVSQTDLLSISKGPFKFEITVLGIPKSRLSAAAASKLYTESPSSLAAREQVQQQIKAESDIYPRTRGRPTKRDRRELVKFKTRN